MVVEWVQLLTNAWCLLIHGQNLLKVESTFSQDDLALEADYGAFSEDSSFLLECSRGGSSTSSNLELGVDSTKADLVVAMEGVLEEGVNLGGMLTCTYNQKTAGLLGGKVSITSVVAKGDMAAYKVSNTQAVPESDGRSFQGMTPSQKVGNLDGVDLISPASCG
ncbi:hypothetical protein F0562_001715 [Nyssa sinensis]|uniref:Uncharacterized protein n=1 Tax=Nyssa sinensis TaxID=561372 RepID=A0A5J5C8Y0_9ASTE|nr:hypothetical protein F0562_001715 [Nyssa sinensis]